MTREELLDEMYSDIEEYYECAGFVDYRERCMQGWTEETIIKKFIDTFTDKDTGADMYDYEYGNVPKNWRELLGV